MEISRKNLRSEVLERIKYFKTCVMARELCLLVRTNRAVLEPSELCQKAAKAVSLGEEEKYLELCAQSCVKCGEARRPQQRKDAYVA